MTVSDLIKELRFKAVGEPDSETARAMKMAANYLEALDAVGEFTDDKRYFSPGTYFEDLNP